jgi:hypothetical protein
MSLGEKQWEPTTIHQVVLEWLRAERHTNVAALLGQLPNEVWQHGIANLLDRANLNDADENRARLRLLYMFRNIFVLEIPPDTEWYVVRNLTDNELGELRAVNYANWIDPMIEMS